MRHDLPQQAWLVRLVWFVVVGWWASAPPEGRRRDARATGYPTSDCGAPPRSLDRRLGLRLLAAAAKAPDDGGHHKADKDARHHRRPPRGLALTPAPHGLNVEEDSATRRASARHTAPSAPHRLHRRPVLRARPPGGRLVRHSLSLQWGHLHQWCPGDRRRLSGRLCHGRTSRQGRSRRG
jgi:hypothetical protein